MFNDTIEKNIAYGENEIDQDKLKDAAEISGCSEFISRFPEGYKSEIGDDGVLLSGGQRQRIAIARAFYKDSPIIILDEATSALDNESELIVQEAIEKLINNRTTIVIAHRLSTIENADKILVLNDGSVSESGTHFELLEKNGIYKNLYQNKFSDSDAKDVSARKSVAQEFLPSITEEPTQQGYLIDAWYKKSWWLYLLTPLTFLFSIIVKSRKNSYLKNQKKIWRSPVPIIVVGNISMGGTGKTPLVKYIASELAKRDFKPGLISRGYGGKYSGTLEVNAETTYKKTGDEAQILGKLKMPFFLDKNRSRGAKKLQEKHDVDEIVPNELQYDWESLRTQVLEYGVRNSTLSAQMPSESSSVVSNATNGIEPPRGYLSVKKSKKGPLKQIVPQYGTLKNNYTLLWDMPGNTGYINIVAVMQKFFDQAISGNWSYNPEHYENSEVPVSVMAQDLLTTYKYGWKTSYYQNTYDNKNDEVEESTESLDSLISQLENAEEEDCESCTI